VVSNPGEVLGVVSLARQNIPRLIDKWGESVDCRHSKSYPKIDKGTFEIDRASASRAADSAFSAAAISLSVAAFR
jgi:hypothetical protein